MMEVLNEESLRKNLKTKWLGQGNKLRVYKEIDSTNEEAKRVFEAEGISGGLFLADSQDSGKGRRGRRWQTPPSTAIAMSYLLTPDIPANTASMLTLIMALASADGIKKATGLETEIKWPNDIVSNGKKLVGILTELVLDKEKIRYCVIGTGINVSMTDFSPEIKDTASSIYLETGKKFSRAEIAASVSESFERYYEKFINSGDLSEFLDEYNSLCANVGKRVRVLDPKGEYEAYSEGINEKGELLIIKDDGSRQAIYAGEVSVRGIYGYS